MQDHPPKASSRAGWGRPVVGRGVDVDSLPGDRHDAADPGLANAGLDADGDPIGRDADSFEGRSELSAELLGVGLLHRGS